MSRYRASLIHLSISLAPISAVLAVVFFAWYPKPSLEVVGAFRIVCLLVLVHLVIGPLLTLLVYKHGKPGLKFDLTFIALLQVAALVYGAHRLYVERPQYLVVVVDRVEFVSGRGIDTAELRFAELKNKRWNELVRVFARRPEDPDEFQAYMNSIIVDGKPDLEGRPEYWEPWSAGTDEIREHVRPVEDLQPDDPKQQQNIARAFAKYGDSHPQLGILPIGFLNVDIGLLIDRESLDILGVLHADPWARTREQGE